MNKSELIEQVATRTELTERGQHMQSTPSGDRRGALAAAARWRRRVRAFPRQRALRRGRQSAHRRADRDRRIARPQVHGRQRPEERCEGPLSTAPGFGEKLAARVAERGSQVVLGLDPDPSELWPPGPGEPRATPATEAVLRHCRALIDATAASCVAVKPQLARFEALGPGGWEVLRAVIGPRSRARPAGHRRRQAGRHRRDRQGLRCLADGRPGLIPESNYAAPTPNEHRVLKMVHPGGSSLDCARRATVEELSVASLSSRRK